MTIPFDDAAAQAMISAADTAAGVFRGQGSGRHGLVSHTLDAEDVVTALESQFGDGAYDVRTRRDIADAYEVQLVTPDRRENYVIAEDLTPGTIRISSSSSCFLLPEGVYPGGSF